MSQDTLSDVLRGVRLRGAVFFNMSGSSEWVAEALPSKVMAPMLMPGVEHVMEYHAVAKGTCWAGIPNGGPSVQLSVGDVVVFPRGDGHVVSSSPGMRGDTNLGWLDYRDTDPLPLTLSYDGAVGRRSPPPSEDVESAIVCGFLGFDLNPFNPLIASLPKLLHLRAGADTAWITQFTQQAVAESHARRPGADAMLARMSEMMFVDAVRRYADQMPDASSGWLAGLRDRFVGRALALMHEKPATDWTLDELGRQVGLSRSTLHERFVQMIGVPPMQYLTQWRMQAAARLLLESRASIASIALDVGYDSEAAFARAFKRQVGQAPGGWRREREALSARTR